MILSAYEAFKEPATRPDMTALNILRLDFGSDPKDARTLLLLIDAMLGYSEALATHTARMENGKIPHDPEWLGYAVEWYGGLDRDLAEIATALDSIDHRAQTQAVNALHQELSREAFDTLCRRCGMEVKINGGV